METYLGHHAKYWLELERKARVLDVVDYIEEIAELRGKVSFYEDRIKKLNDFMVKPPLHPLEIKENIIRLKINSSQLTAE